MHKSSKKYAAHDEKSVEEGDGKSEEDIRRRRGYGDEDMVSPADVETGGKSSPPGGGAMSNGKPHHNKEKEDPLHATGSAATGTGNKTAKETSKLIDWYSPTTFGDNYYTRPDEHATTYFNDGETRIDYVLVWEEYIAKGKTESSEKMQEKKSKQKKHNDWRETFFDNLKKADVLMEEETVESGKKIIHFLKLSAPWPVLIYYAELLCMRAPLQHLPNPPVNWSAGVFKFIGFPNIFEEDVPNQPPDFYTCAFKQSKIDRFLGSDNHDTYFTSTQRHRILYEILQTTTYGKVDRAEIGLARLLGEDVFAAGFPLHDGPYERPNYYKVESALNKRQILYEYWAKWGKWYRYQPLDHIRDYFGEKIAIYFAWLGFYTAWLIPAAAVGVLVFMYGMVTLTFNQPANEICGSADKYKMCPMCDETYGCRYWYLADICMYSRISYLFDNAGTVFYAVFMSFWAVTFLEYWKRKSARVAHHWDCSDYQEEEEKPRPEFVAKVLRFEKNPVTGNMEPFMPEKKRLPRYLTSIGIITVMMMLVFIFIVAVVLYRVMVSIPLFQNTATRSRALTIASMSGAVVNLVLIMAIGKVYEKLAYKLTEWEMHRTESDFENNHTFKVFIFQFVNFYSSIFYVAFFKGK